MISVWWNRLLAALAAIAGLMLAATALLVAVGIVSRYFFGYPIGWASEVGGYVLLYIAFLAAPWVLAREGHVTVDLVVEAISERKAAAVHVANSLVGTIVFGYVAYWGLLATMQAYERGYPMPTVLSFPRWILLAVIPIGSALLAVEFLARAYRFYLRTRGDPARG